MSRQAQGNQDNSLDGLILAMCVVFLAVVIWYFGGPHFIPVIYHIKDYEITAIRFVIEKWNILTYHLTFLPHINATKLFDLQTSIQTNNISLSYSVLTDTLDQVGQYTRFVFCPILLALGVWLYFKNVTLKMRNVFNMNTMKTLEQHNWPQIAPVVGLNLVKEDIHKGPWAMSQTPMQFCKHHNLLLENKNEETQQVTVSLLKQEAQQVFVLQLGPLWGDINALPLHMKALFAAFAACANQDRDAAFKLLQHIDVTFAAGKVDFAGTHELLQKHLNSKVVLKVLQKHAYLFTVMPSMLELARTDGVFASSEFLWLKAMNRRLWYVLNSVGRQTAVPEAAGPFAHWLAERKWGGGLRTPMVEEAVKALEVALADIIYEPEEE
ncbi:MAG: type IVB secretion system coupling complex protein DotM/IcmP [Gammaproteobacteria bacterium]